MSDATPTDAELDALLLKLDAVNAVADGLIEDMRQAEDREQGIAMCHDLMQVGRVENIVAKEIRDARTD